MIDKDDRLIAERYSSRGKLITEAEWPKFGRFPGDDPGPDPEIYRKRWDGRSGGETIRGNELHIGVYTPERSKEFGQYFYDVLRANSTTVSDEAIHAHVDNWITDQLARRNINSASPTPEWAATIESIKGLVPAAMMDAREEDPTTEMYSEAIPYARGSHPGTVQRSVKSGSPIFSKDGGPKEALDYLTKVIYSYTVPTSVTAPRDAYPTRSGTATYDEPPTKDEFATILRQVDNMFEVGEQEFETPTGTFGKWGLEEYTVIRDGLSNLKFSGKFGNSTRDRVITYIDSILKEKYPQGSTVGDLKTVELDAIPKDADYSGMEQDTTTNKKFKEFFLEYDADFGKDPTPAADFGKAPPLPGTVDNKKILQKPVASAPGPVGNLKSALMAAKPGDSFSMIEVGDALWPDDTITNRHAIELRLYRPLKIGSIFKDIAFWAKHYDFDTMDKRTGAPQGGGGWDEFIKELESQAGGTWMTDYGIDQKNPEGLGGPGHNFQFGDDVPGIAKLGWNPLKWPANYSKEIDKMGMTPEMKWLPQVKVWKVADDNRTPGTVGMMGTYSTADPMGYWKKKSAAASAIGSTDADTAQAAADRQKNSEYIDAIAKKMAAGKKEWWT